MTFAGVKHWLDAAFLDKPLIYHPHIWLVTLYNLNVQACKVQELNSMSMDDEDGRPTIFLWNRDENVLTIHWQKIPKKKEIVLKEVKPETKRIDSLQACKWWLRGNSAGSFSSHEKMVLVEIMDVIVRQIKQQYMRRTYSSLPWCPSKRLTKSALWRNLQKASSRAYKHANQGSRTMWMCCMSEYCKDCMGFQLQSYFYGELFEWSSRKKNKKFSRFISMLSTIHGKISQSPYS